jgi:hypothetical protein
MGTIIATVMLPVNRALPAASNSTKPKKDETFAKSEKLDACRLSRGAPRG